MPYVHVCVCCLSKAQARPWIPSRPVESVTSSCPDLVGSLKTLMRCPRTAVGYFRGGVARGMDQPWCSSYDRPLRVPTKGIQVFWKRPPTRAGPVLSLTLGRAQAPSPCSANHAARICKADGGSEVGVPRTLRLHGIFFASHDTCNLRVNGCRSDGPGVLRLTPVACSR